MQALARTLLVALALLACCAQRARAQQQEGQGDGARVPVPPPPCVLALINGLSVESLPNSVLRVFGKAEGALCALPNNFLGAPGFQVTVEGKDPPAGSWKLCPTASACGASGAESAASGADGGGATIRATISLTVTTTAGGAWEVFFRQLVPGSGPITVTVTTVTLQIGNPVTPPTAFVNGPSSVTLNGPVDPTAVALAPAKAFAHVGERVQLFALVTGANGAAAVGAPVVFKAAGDCSPSVAQSATTADAAGRAAVVVSSRKPGVVAVVAAARNAAGVALVSPAAHIIFKEAHHRHHGYEEEEYERDGGYDRYHAYAEEAAKLAAAEASSAAQPAR